MSNLDPQLRDFILFCVKRSGKSWPDLYDEIAIVAGQKLFEGLDYNEIKRLGLSLRVNDLDQTVQLIEQAIFEVEQT